MNMRTNRVTIETEHVVVVRHTARTKVWCTQCGAEVDTAAMNQAGRSKRDWDFSREFMLRAAHSTDKRPDYLLLCRGGAAAAQERLSKGSKKDSLALLAEGEEVLRHALESPLSSSGLSEEEVSFGRAIRNEVAKRIEQNERRWI